MVWIVALLVACERDHAAESKIKREVCAADELGELQNEWYVIDDCTADSTECRTACTRGDGDACFNFAIALQARDGESTQPRQYFERACKAGLAIGCTNWGANMMASGAAPSWRCTYRLFERTCDVGDPFGCSMAARLLVEWPRTPLDPWIGYAQLTRACDEMKGPPCRFLAFYIEQGKFGASDPARVQALLGRACDGGDDGACGDHETADETLDGSGRLMVNQN